MDTDTFVRLLNTESHPVLSMVLLGEPVCVELHWVPSDGPRGRTRPCVVSAYRNHRGVDAPAEMCKWCSLEQPPKGYHYAPVLTLAPGSGDGRPHYEPAIVQLPMVLLAHHADRLKRGRTVRAHHLGSREKKARFELASMNDPEKLPATFDVVTAVLRLKGMKELPPIPESKPEERRDWALKFPGVRTA